MPRENLALFKFHVNGVNKISHAATTYFENGLRESELYSFPAWEIVKVLQIDALEVDWRLWFERAGGRCVNGRLVALKTDTVWKNLLESFDAARAAGMDWHPVPREQCIGIGLIGPDPEIHGTVTIDGRQYNADELNKLARRLHAGAMMPGVKVTVKKS